MKIGDTCYLSVCVCVHVGMYVCTHLHVCMCVCTCVHVLCVYTVCATSLNDAGIT